MKKFTQTTLIALLIGTFVFAQKGSPGNQAAPSQATVIVGALRGSVMLLSPADGKSIAVSDAFKPVLFRWTAVSPKPKEAVTYRLKVWQLMQGQNAAEAMRTHQPIVTKDVINITQAAISNLYTGPCKPPYLCDFVWGIEVLNGEGVSIGNSYAVNSSFNFEVENTATENVEGGNKGNAGNTGMAGGKSLDAQGDPIHGADIKPGVKSASNQGDPVHGVDVKLGMKKQDKELDKNQPNAKKVDKESDKMQPAMHIINLPAERIIHDEEGNVVAMAAKTKNGSISVLVDEAKLLEVSKKQAVKAKMTDAACLSALHNYLHTGNTRASGPGICWVWVNCNTPGHMPGCGSMMPVVCDPAPIFK